MSVAVTGYWKPMSLDQAHLALSPLDTSGSRVPVYRGPGLMGTSDISSLPVLNPWELF
jgi:hypothetical protein